MPDPFSSPANPGGERPQTPEFKVAPCVPTAKAFLEVVQKSRLVPRRVLDGLRREYSASNRPDPVKLAISLVASGHVTQWQAQQLLAGHSQFSLGCTLFFLLTGNTAISGQSDQEQLRRLVTGEHLSVRSFVADIPPGVEQVLTKMLARRPEDRYQTPQEVANALWPFSASTMKDFATARFPVPIPAAIAAQLTPPTNLQAAVDTSMNEFVDRLSNQPLNPAGSTTTHSDPAMPAETDRLHEPTATVKSVRRRRRRRLPIIVIAVLCGLVIAAVLWKTLRPGPVRKAGVNRPTIDGPSLSAYITDSCRSSRRSFVGFRPPRLQHSQETDVTTTG
jgi:serine/threonine protein kinase